MLSLVLREMQRSKEPISITALSEKMNIDRSALEGMLDYLSHKGRVIKECSQDEELAKITMCMSCGKNCPGSVQCPFAIKMPKKYSVNPSEEELDDDLI